LTLFDEKRQAALKLVRLLAWAMLVAAPLVNLFVAYIAKIERHEGGEYDMMLYFLLIVSIFQPATARFIEHFQITSYQKSEESKVTPEGLFTTLSVIKFAFIETIYLFGLVVYIVAGNLSWMLYFYPIGIAWTFVYWPRQSTFENFLQRIEAKLPWEM